MTRQLTSVMATLSDLRANPDFVRLLRKSGADSVRINSAHVTPEILAEMVKTVRSTAPDMKILMDTKGPELRTNDVTAPIRLKEGDEVEIHTSTLPCSDNKIRTSINGITALAEPGITILLDDGAIAIEVTEVDETETIHGVTSRGGCLDARKTMAFSHGRLPALPAVSERDRLMIEAAREVGIDMIAHSFVRSAADVEAVREVTAGSDIRLYAKIECREALKRLDEIIEAADGILVARGDLGTAVDVTEIPAIQNDVVMRCRRIGRPTIVATQILQSMIHSPVPTRAELSDIALAVMEGVDCLLLCGETAMGDYPAECVDIMSRTIKSVELNSLRCKIN